MTGAMKRLFWILITTGLIVPTAEAAERTIGVVMSGNIRYYQEVHKAFVKAMAREGFGYPKVNTILQMPAPDTISWANAARKLIAADVDMIVTYGAGASLAAIYETKRIPIVFAGVYDPLAIDVVAKNAAGMSSKVPMVSLLKYFKKLKPFTKLAVIYNEMEPDSLRQLDELKQLETQHGFQIVKMPIKRPDDAKKLVFSGKADAVLVTTSSVALEALDSIVKLAREARIPTACSMSNTAELGAVLSLGPSAVEQGEAAARIAVRILRGENPVGILLDVPRMIELVVNFKEAEAVGIKVSMDIINDATKVIR